MQWLPYDLAEVIKLIGEIFEPKTFFFKQILYLIPPALLLFLPYYCHSFRIIVIPSVLNSVIPFVLRSVLPSEYCHFKKISSWIAPVTSHTWSVRKLDGRAGHICEYVINEEAWINGERRMEFWFITLKIGREHNMSQGHRNVWEQEDWSSQYSADYLTLHIPIRRGKGADYVCSPDKVVLITLLHSGGSDVYIVYVLIPYIIQFV